MNLRSDPRATDRTSNTLLSSLCSLLAAPSLFDLSAPIAHELVSLLGSHQPLFRLATMDVSEMSFDPGALTPEAVEAARRISSSWPDDLINYVFLKEQGRFFAFLQPNSRQRAKFYAVLENRQFNLSWIAYYAFVRATIFERVPQVLRHATTVSQVLGPEVVQVYDLNQAVRRFMQVCRTICVSPSTLIRDARAHAEYCTGLRRTPV